MIGGNLKYAVLTDYGVNKTTQPVFAASRAISKTPMALKVTISAVAGVETALNVATPSTSFGDFSNRIPVDLPLSPLL